MWGHSQWLPLPTIVGAAPALAALATVVDPVW